MANEKELVGNRAERRKAKKSNKRVALREISEEELKRRRKRNKIAKQSRKENR